MIAEMEEKTDDKAIWIGGTKFKNKQEATSIFSLAVISAGILLFFTGIAIGLAPASYVGIVIIVLGILSFFGNKKQNTSKK